MFLLRYIFSYPNYKYNEIHLNHYPYSFTVEIPN